jgi:hypothetical protein
MYFELVQSQEVHPPACITLLGEIPNEEVILKFLVEMLTRTQDLLFAKRQKTMDSLQVDVLVYPSWNNRPALIERFEEEYQ